MPMYVGLYSFTEQGVKGAKGTVDRATEFAARLPAGAKVHQLLWTIGRYDMVVVFEAPSHEIAVGGQLQLGMAGNVRTETLRAFTADEMKAILAGLP